MLHLNHSVNLLLIRMIKKCKSFTHHRGLMSVQDQKVLRSKLFGEADWPTNTNDPAERNWTVWKARTSPACSSILPPVLIPALLGVLSPKSLFETKIGAVFPALVSVIYSRKVRSVKVPVERLLYCALKLRLYTPLVFTVKLAPFGALWLMFVKSLQEE